VINKTYKSYWFQYYKILREQNVKLLISYYYDMKECPHESTYTLNMCAHCSLLTLSARVCSVWTFPRRRQYWIAFVVRREHSRVLGLLSKGWICATHCGCESIFYDYKISDVATKTAILWRRC